MTEQNNSFEIVWKEYVKECENKKLPIQNKEQCRWMYEKGFIDGYDKGLSDGLNKWLRKTWIIYKTMNKNVHFKGIKRNLRGQLKWKKNKK